MASNRLRKEPDMKTEYLELQGLAVHDVDGDKIGEVADFYCDIPTSEPEWLVVTTGLLDKKDVLVPMDGIVREEDELQTPYEKGQVMDAPAVTGADIDPDTEAALYEYYHVRRELPSRTDDEAPFEQRQDDPALGPRLRSWKAWSAPL
jgi:sporulation protein YlmC with PRC-barrel domain